MDAVTSERLIELRTLLLEALARTGDRSVPGCHAALVLLDGVCEHAMALAAASSRASSRLVQAAKHLVIPSPLTI